MGAMTDHSSPDPMTFASVAAFRRWLGVNGRKSGGIWVRFFRKGSGVGSVTYPEALDEALCHGWIDGQLKPFDRKSWLRRFTPRRPRSLWSRVNIGHAERLIRAGRMRPAGMAEVRSAKADGRWKRAYAPSSSMTVPPDFMAALAQDASAAAFFRTLNKANTYAIAYRLRTAKRPETRAARMKKILALLHRRTPLHP